MRGDIMYGLYVRRFNVRTVRIDYEGVGMLNAARIVLLKSELRAAYREYMAMDTYGAGNELFNHMTGGRLDAARNKCNEILRELRTLDPNAPKGDVT